MSSRVCWLLRRNRSRTELSTLELGTIFRGARAGLPFGDGSTNLSINQRANQPGVISTAVPDGLPSKDFDIEETYCSFVRHRCSMHCPTLHAVGRGCQFSCSGEISANKVRVRSSAASSCTMSREGQAGDARAGCIVLKYSDGTATRDECKPLPANDRLHRFQRPLARLAIHVHMRDKTHPLCVGGSG